MNKSTFLLGCALSLTPSLASAVNSSSQMVGTHEVIENTQTQTQTILGTPMYSQEAIVDGLAGEVLFEIQNKYPHTFSQEQLQIIKEMLEDREFVSQVSNIQHTNAWNKEDLIQSLIFALIYGLAYMPMLISVNQGMPIRTSSFLGFASASAGSIYVNGWVPGSLVYAETTLLALVISALHVRNKMTGNVIYKEP